ncbi:Aste57867_1837 [Aphanomyces stellatus]|uniref:Aste57867_1837 protein n=1 Tax=Aphanomyces stellatus TaxID=120398 RepID=A0A485KBB0_9STRA|nr:hypothetical protein As57867_001835 [Aphanomyces stellatus]VFT79045.1 Aste57867_1837 [Aphanomyces stellatus]
MSRLRHPNVVMFFGTAIDPPKYCLGFEYMENGPLTDLIRRRWSPVGFFCIAHEIALGMNYLHLSNFLHRDLKSGNILLDSHGTIWRPYRWMAPEVIGKELFSLKADVYCFGVILWEMIAKDQPFKGLSPIQAAFAVARQGTRPAFPDNTPPCLRTLVDQCWHQNPDD